MTHTPRLYAAAAVLILLSAAVTFAQPTFINPIPIPPLIDAATGTIQLEMRITSHKFNPGDPSSSFNGGANQPNGITTYAYNIAGSSAMTILGPTLKWHTLQNTSLTVTNLLGAGTTTHWHGAEVPAMMDGGPHEQIEPGDTWQVDFTTLDSASTMWFHPHYHNTTVEQVQMGLSGMILVEQAGDPIASTLPRTYGVDDIPVIIGDLGLTGSADTSLYIDTAKGKRPYNLVNGVMNPYVEVPAHVIRLRILNGSTRKGLLFGVSESYDDPFSNLIPFYLIASDGGYTIKPDTLTQLLNGPGVRDEIILDLSNYSPGDILYLSNLKDSLPNYIIGSPKKAPNGGGQDTTMGNAFLQLRVVADDQFNDYTPVTSFTPFTTEWTRGLADTANTSSSPIVKYRLKRLVMTSEVIHGKTENMFTIDSTTYDMEVINDTVCVDTREVWAIQNISTVAHPFHIHKIQFRVLDVRDANGDLVDLEAYGMNGPKDDVLVLPGWTLRFLGQFDDYPSPIDPMNTYMYHCHILTHEDSIGGGMMHQFVVTDEGDCAGSSVTERHPISSGLVFISSVADGTLYLKGGSENPTMIAITDIGGRRLRSQELSPFEGRARIDIDGLPPGVYMVEWQTNRGMLTGKIMIGQ